MKTLKIFSLAIFIGFIGQSCSPAGGNSPGHEYMPDMVHSTAVEANVNNYYWYHTWDSDEYLNYASPRKPVKNTIARGYWGNLSGDSSSRQSYQMAMSGDAFNNAIRVNPNGKVAYLYGDSEEERTRAKKEITRNAYPISAQGLEKGKQLYGIYCAICHGDKGDGAGYLVREDGGVYPAQPANFLKDEFITSSEGRYYHAIMYGFNVMGGYSDKLSYEERWQVIHHIRALQAASKNLVYSEKENTLTNSIAKLEAVKSTVNVATPVVAPPVKKNK
ncbi:MAG: cytochrome c [Saprospiraceae bacterium]|jgi:mono/diheme cytochrome c family protein|nr:cytochrome c [Saprospiraceae bacterium]